MRRIAQIALHVDPPRCDIVQSRVVSVPLSGPPNASHDGPAVLYDLTDHVATITLNRPGNRNAMTSELLSEFRAVVKKITEDPSIRCVVIAGKGRNFCGGADMSASTGVAGADVGRGIALPNESTMDMYSNFLSLLDVKVPIIGALTGHAIGGGLGLALCCDIRIANAGSQYGANFVRLGLHPGMATTYLLPCLVGIPRAMELLMTGRLITGDEATRIGLCVECAPDPASVLTKAMDMAKQIAANSPVAVRWTKQSVYRHLSWDVRRAAWDEANLQAQTFRLDDFKEGARALLEKRTPQFKGR